MIFPPNAMRSIALLTCVMVASTSMPLKSQKSDDGCDPNYPGNCVPIASDLDFAGGKGNGLVYVRGPDYVVGSDIYGLDRAMDGVGYE